MTDVVLTGLAKQLVLSELLNEKTAQQAYQQAQRDKVSLVSYLVQNKLMKSLVLAEIASERVPQAQADHRELLALLKAGRTADLLEKVAQHNHQALKAYQRLMQSGTFTIKH